MLSIASNSAAVQAADNVTITSNELNTTIGQLSSGSRLDEAAIDPAALGISDSLQDDIAGYTQANQNALDGQSIMNTASAALTQTSSILASMRSLAMEAANTDINGSTSGETNVMQEFSQLQAELDQIDNGTTYNGVNLFSPDTNGETATPGTATAAGPTYSFQVGITGGTADVVSISGANFDISSTGLGVGTLQSATFASGYSINGGTGGAGTIDNYTDADAVISNIATAIQSISLYQGQLGAVSNRLGSDLQTTSVASQSLEAANSAIADTNVATTSAMFASQQTLEQAGVAVLAQANQLSALALKLLQ